MSIEELVKEGVEMQHCAGDAAHQEVMTSGRCVFYRVLQPVRATVMLMLDDDLDWTVVEIQGRRNASLKAGVERRIRSWFAPT